MRLVRGWSVLNDNCPRNERFVVLRKHTRQKFKSWLQTNSSRFKEESGSAVIADVMDRCGNASKQAEAAGAFSCLQP
jgi:hypothetical protein